MTPARPGLGFFEVALPKMLNSLLVKPTAFASSFRGFLSYHWGKTSDM